MAAGIDRRGGAEQDAAQSADYIADLTKQLAGVARSSRLDMLAYLLDIAHLEACEQAGRSPDVAASQRDRPVRG